MGSTRRRSGLARPANHRRASQTKGEAPRRDSQVSEPVLHYTTGAMPTTASAPPYSAWKWAGPCSRKYMRMTIP